MKESSTTRLSTMDALRGIAALWVTLFHYTMGIPGGALKWVSQNGWLGVVIFFVISGCVIPLSLSKVNYSTKAHFFPFMGKRLLRLHPPFLASLVFTLGLAYLSLLIPAFKGDVPNFSIGEIASHVPLLNGILGLRWVQIVYWTLAIELQYYILIGLLFPLLFGENHRLRNVLLVLLGATALIPVGVFDDKVWILPHLSVFTLGIVVFLRMKEKVSQRGYLLASIAIGGVLCLMGRWLEGVTGLVSGLLLTYNTLPWPSFLCRLGTISYSLYLLHGPIGVKSMNLLNRLSSHRLPAELVVLGALLVALLASTVFYFFVEKPAIKLAGRIRF